MNRKEEETAGAGDQLGRRGFLGAVTAALALAGSEGCRRSVERIVPYGSAPEVLIPGKPLHYATVLARRGDSLGLVVESHEGRPTKMEGNPSHPSSLGAADLIAQASILDLYDPERSPAVLRAGAPSTWDAFSAELSPKLRRTDGGRGLAVLTQPTLSPTVVRLHQLFAQRFPKARLVRYAAVGDGNVRRGAELAFGKRLQPLYFYDQARVILSLDADFLQTESGNVRAHKLFSAARKPGQDMSRLYVVEPGWTTTGMAADHRLRAPRTQVAAYAAAIAAELARQGLRLGPVGDAAASAAAQSSFPIAPAWLAPLARDLRRAGDRAILVAGASQPATVHALVHAINRALGSEGRCVRYFETTDPADDGGTEALSELVSAAGRGELDTLLVLGGNPAYDAPADVAFGDALGKVAFSVHLAQFRDETSHLCTWHLPMAHELEAWGDQRALDGTLAVQQPLIAPLFGGKSEIELWALLAGAADAPHDLVRATLRAPLLASAGMVGCGDGERSWLVCSSPDGSPARYPTLAFEHDWKTTLHDGLLRGGPTPAAALELDSERVATAWKLLRIAPAPSKGQLEVAFAPDAKMFDGRHANNTWLQELPDPVTKLAWDNAALVSPATASELGVGTGDMVRLARGGRSLLAAVLVIVGTADATIVLSLGWGRRRAGRIGNGRGFDATPLRTTDAMWSATAVTASATGQRHALARTQLTDSMEGRPLARMGTLAEYMAQPHFAELQRAPRRSLPLWTDVDYSKGHQWGMSIDLNACTGCTACIVACQAENNIPVVGKEEVIRGRDMQWLRLDRYFVEDGPAGAKDPLVVIQPVACVQCEEAPCENVCPVAALEHSSEGLSEITYNRCIGTRYCANNCPYKVRRFNYLNWHNDGVWKETGGLPETIQMQQNPNVTVRFRGIVEKCSYCVQRIQGRRLEAHGQGKELRDGDVVTACQQTCPADAIVFGDLNDMSSRVSQATIASRRYSLLEELGTKPRTTYLAKVVNPNPEMA